MFGKRWFLEIAWLILACFVTAIILRFFDSPWVWVPLLAVAALALEHFRKRTLSGVQTSARFDRFLANAPALVKWFWVASMLALAMATTYILDALWQRGTAMMAIAFVVFSVKEGANTARESHAVERQA